MFKTENPDRLCAVPLAAAEKPRETGEGASATDMTGKQAAHAMETYWDHMPTEAVQVSVGTPGSEGKAAKPENQRKESASTDSAAVGTRHMAEPGTTRPDVSSPGRHDASGRDSRMPNFNNGLPAGWKKGIDSLHRTYYYNSYLGESSWTPPPGSHLHTRHEARRQAAASSDSARSHRHQRESSAMGDDHSSQSTAGHLHVRGGRRRGGHGGDDYTARAAHKDFMSWLSHMFDSAREANQKAEALHRRTIASRAKPFVSGRMSAKESQSALNGFWNSVDAEDSEDAEHTGKSKVRAPARVIANAHLKRDASSDGTITAPERVGANKLRRRISRSHSHSGPSQKFDSRSVTGSRQGHLQQANSRVRGARGRKTARTSGTFPEEHVRSSASRSQGPRPVVGSTASAASFGLPVGNSAAISMTKHKLTSDEAHMKLEGYFSRMEDNAKAEDHYDENTRMKLQDMALARKVKAIKEMARKAQAVSASAEELLKPMSQKLQQKRSVSQTAAAGSALPLPQGTIVEANGTPPAQFSAGAPVGRVTIPPDVATQPPRMVPPAQSPTAAASPPAFSSAYNSFLAQVNKQAGVQLQQKEDTQQEHALAAKKSAAAAAARERSNALRNAELDLQKTARAAKLVRARNAERKQLAEAFPVGENAQLDQALRVPHQQAATKDVETGFLNTIIQRANSAPAAATGGSGGRGDAIDAMSPASGPSL